MADNPFEFPSIKKSITDFLDDEDGNITRSKMVMLGSMLLVMTTLFAIQAAAKHRSHSSHRSHFSHRSHSNSHGSHSNHGSHGSHSSHASHTSHQNDAYHSNSLYSAEGDVAYGPTIWSVPGVNNQVTSGSSVPSLCGGAGGSYYGATTIGSTSSNGTSGHITGDSMLPNLTPYSGGEGVGVVSAPPVPDTIPIEDFGEVASE